MILQKTDSIGYIPKRIISLVPSQTELLAHFGLEAETVGITKFCIHPKNWFNSKERIGGTKTINLQKIKALQPHLIIANKEENVKEQVEELAKYYPVWLTDVNNLPDALQMINDIGVLTGRQDAATALVNEISLAFKSLLVMEPPIRTAYLIWRKPYITVGADTFIHNMLTRCGFDNIFSNQNRYPVINLEELKQCELLLLSSEPYPFKQKHINELSSRLPGTKILLADGEFFSWYGSRLQQSPGYFKQLIDQVKAM